MYPLNKWNFTSVCLFWWIFKNLICIRIQILLELFSQNCCQYWSKLVNITGGPKKHETWKTTRGLLTDILELLKGTLIKTSLWEIILRHDYLTLLNRDYMYSFFIWSIAIGMSHVFSDILHRFIKHTTSLHLHLCRMFIKSRCAKQLLHWFFWWYI